MDHGRSSVGHDYSAEDGGLDYGCQEHKLTHHSHFHCTHAIGLLDQDGLRFRDSRVQKLHLKDDVKKWLVKRLKPPTADEYTYLWVTLVFAELEKKKLRGIGRMRLAKLQEEEIPASFDDAYERMLSRTSSSERTLVSFLFVFCWQQRGH
jgi:hypothetical protein